MPLRGLRLPAAAGAAPLLFPRCFGVIIGVAVEANAAICGLQRVAIATASCCRCARFRHPLLCLCINLMPCLCCKTD
jgi:hypothetical protein